MDNTVAKQSFLPTGNSHIAKSATWFWLKRPTLRWGTLRNQWVHFRRTYFCNAMIYCILFPCQINIHFTCVSNVIILSLMCFWQTHVFYQSLITSWHTFPVHHYWFMSGRSVLPVYFISIKLFAISEKWVTFFPARNCYQLPSSWGGVASFSVKILNCHISRTRRTRIPVFSLNLDLVKYIIYAKNHTILHKWTVCIWSLFGIS